MDDNVCKNECEDDIKEHVDGETQKDDLKVHEGFDDNVVKDEIEEDTSKEETDGDLSKEEKVDDGDDDSRKLFVGGLSWETTEEDMKTYFSKWGKVLSCSIKLDKITGNSRGFGFVSMENENCIRNVINHGEHRLKNKKIDPKPAKPTREVIKKIFVGGLLPEVSEDQIKEYFSRYGTVETVDLPFDSQKGKRKTYIFLTFSTEEAAKIATVNEKQDVCGSKCDVKLALPKDQLLKNRMTPWSYGNDLYPTVPDYYSYQYPYSSYDPYSYEDNSYSGYYRSHPYGYSYPMPPQPYVAPPRASLAPGKINNRGRGNTNFHPYARPL